MQFARAIAVTIPADDIDSPIVHYGHPLTALFFPIKLVTLGVNPGWGRVTFEGLDSIRCCRGEHLPCDSEEFTSWVFEVLDSPWLQERHNYEMQYYKYPLLEEYHHYIFTFHDEFVEAIAKGIWVESIGTQMSDDISPEHPLMDLPQSLAAESFVVDRLQCQVRRNARPISELIAGSKLCSQKLFQFYLTLEGVTKESYSAELRTVNGKSTTRLRAGWPYKDRIAIEGVAQLEAVMPAWEEYVREVAQRRREIGKCD